MEEQQRKSSFLPSLAAMVSAPLRLGKQRLPRIFLHTAWLLWAVGSGASHPRGDAAAVDRFFPLRMRGLPCLRLRGGNIPRTPLTPARASRRLAQQSPELKNASPSLLSGRQKKTRSHTQGDR